MTARLKHFLQLQRNAEKCSFLKAADELHISAVSVMNLVNSIEDTAGVKLFERTHRGVKLTAAGSSFRDDMASLLNMADSAIQKAREISQS